MTFFPTNAIRWYQPLKVKADMCPSRCLYRLQESVSARTLAENRIALPLAAPIAGHVHDIGVHIRGAHEPNCFQLLKCQLTLTLNQRGFPAGSATSRQASSCAKFPDLYQRMTHDVGRPRPDITGAYALESR